MDTNVRGGEAAAGISEDEEKAAGRLTARPDDEEIALSNTAITAVGDFEPSEAESEGIPLIQISQFDGRGKDGGSGPSSPDVPQCRICLDSGGEDLISPCRCRGTQKYVHRECLDHWRAAKVVGLLSLLVYTFYGDELREMFGYKSHPFGFYTLVVTVALLVGLLYGFFIAIICGQNISNRHYHILAKHELTKEYVVENMNEDEEAPELDSGHINELKMLGLF